MAKGIGLIGNFKGKVGNMVGYKLSDSNTGNTQGIRVYQPIVRNPKTSAQAEQRAKLAPINATYRALKMVIDRGNEGLPYGNKSRLAWLKQAFKAEGMPWIEKGQIANYPVVCQLTKGSLVGLNYTAATDVITVVCDGLASETQLNTVGALSTAIKAGYPTIKDGDQITFVFGGHVNNDMVFDVLSIVIDPTSVEAISNFESGGDQFTFEGKFGGDFGAVIVSREGANGEHLRSTATLKCTSEKLAAAPYDATSKEAAIESYMSAAGANADWAEESIQ